MELHNNMEFEMKSSFIPNFSNSDTLKIIEVTDASVIVQMDKAGCRGVFPRDSFNYWIRKNSLIQINDQEEKTS
ncbi:hypothetical protein [Bacillus tuaregi]|uniref:hypothetical protein n=1 Tax=Bacillus tuaregi TaxID=1816695 RepID=UPI0008F7EDDB|nr:hypothetical protein [Bacillus tuaregi]